MRDVSAEQQIWPADANAAIPYWVYTSPIVYARELERIWYGRHWLYCGLEAEVPEVGSYRTVTLGERSVVMVRSSEAQISVLENRCAHHGTKICWNRAGKVSDLVCPYHQWNYALNGRLQGVPFRRGVAGQGGMPKDFDPAAIRLRSLKVETANGVVWASFCDDTAPLKEYLGPAMWRFYTRLFSGRSLRVMGYNRQRIRGNWKLMLENNKDPYHAALLHVFFATFGLFRPDQKSALYMDDTGRHACLTSVMGNSDRSKISGALPGYDGQLRLQDARLIQAVKELEGEETVAAITAFPSVILLQQVNSMQVRTILPRGHGEFDFVWTHFGFADDDPEMADRRVRHANLFGPSGFVSADDAEVIRMAQQGFAKATDEAAITLMGGRGIESATNMATETAIRGMYAYYRQVMDL
jgi:salicylate 5-hydroxylase large subunit